MASVRWAGDLDAYLIGLGAETCEPLVATHMSGWATYFHPSTHALREDRRFSRLADELGLERYRKAADGSPDYKRLAVKA